MAIELELANGGTKAHLIDALGESSRKMQELYNFCQLNLDASMKSCNADVFEEIYKIKSATDSLRERIEKS